MNSELNIPEHVYKDSIYSNNVSLMNIIGEDIYVVGDSITVRFFKRVDGETKAISLDIPYYTKQHPEKLEATKWSLFSVFEYTKRDAYTSEEVDWASFKNKFNICLTNIIDYGTGMDKCK